MIPYRFRISYPACGAVITAAILACVSPQRSVAQVDRGAISADEPQDRKTSPTPDSEPAADWFSKKTRWHSFDRFHFRRAGRDAYLVVPAKALPGRPWIWRARFPGFHNEMDIELIRAGYHLAYFDVANQFGSPSIIKKADQFYRFMVEQRHLNVQPVLEGVSRGGLFVYNWAAANPQFVSCIYCDTPVLDFRSWPGGKGSGMGSEAAWASCLSAYGLTADQAEAFDQQPIDHARVIAQARIPILHIVSENDRVVPPTENTYLFRKELEKFGHTMTVISVREGTKKSNGHHFEHPEPTRVVEFIRRHAEQSAKIVAE